LLDNNIKLCHSISVLRSFMILQLTFVYDEYVKIDSSFFEDDRKQQIFLAISITIFQLLLK
jgi:hypothetical protein